MKGMSRARRLLPLGFVLLGIAIVLAATRLDFLQGTTSRGNDRRDPAPEFTGIAGKYVPLAETIRGFKEILEGRYDTIPEQAFYMQGNIDMVVENAQRMGAG